MKALRFTAKEVAYLRARLSEPAEAPRERIAILKKLDAAEAPSTNVDVAPIEQALLGSARGKVVALDRSGYGRASVQAGRLGVTADDAALVGAWLARTHYFTGPMTLLDVLNKWPSWVAKARATAPPPSAPSGFGEGAAEKDAKPQGGTAVSGTGAPGRLRPGFGR